LKKFRKRTWLTFKFAFARYRVQQLVLEDKQKRNPAVADNAPLFGKLPDNTFSKKC